MPWRLMKRRKKVFQVSGLPVKRSLWPTQRQHSSPVEVDLVDLVAGVRKAPG